jgi:hypothetical protein
LNEWVKKAEVDAGKRAGVPTEMAERMKALEREVRERRQANEILRKASAYFAQAELDRPLRKRPPSWRPMWRAAGSSRCAGFCGSPPPPGTSTFAARPIPTFAPHGRRRTSRCRRRSSVSTPGTSTSTVRRRSGCSSTAKASRSAATASPG